MKKLLALAWLFGALVLYAVSSGPVWYIVSEMDDPIGKMRAIYYPLTLLGDDAERWFDRYCTLWAPPIL